MAAKRAAEFLSAHPLSPMPKERDSATSSGHATKVKIPIPPEPGLLSSRISDIFDNCETLVQLHRCSASSAVDSKRITLPPELRFDDDFVSTPGIGVSNAKAVQQWVDIGAREQQKKEQLQKMAVRFMSNAASASIEQQAQENDPTLPRVENIVDSPSLLIQHYNAVLVAYQEQTVRFLLMSKALPCEKILLKLSNGIRRRCTLKGQILSAILPGLDEGNYFVSFHPVKEGSLEDEILSLQLVTCVAEGDYDSSVTPAVSTKAIVALPISVVPEENVVPVEKREPKHRRRGPRLCYSLAPAEVNSGKLSVPTVGSSKGKQMPGPYTEEEIDTLLDETETAELKRCPRNEEAYLLPNPRRRERNGLSLHRRALGHVRTSTMAHQVQTLTRQERKQRFEDRLRKCQQEALGHPDLAANIANSSLTPPLGVIGKDSRFPLALRMMLWESCPHYNRLAIAQYHSQLFEFQQFKVLSAHLFMKSHPKDLFSIFAFTLTPQLARGTKPDEAQQSDGTRHEGSADGAPPLKYIAELDRFEGSERRCADPRFWKTVDSCIPSKNKRATNYKLPKSLTDEECPVPPVLLKGRSPYKSYPEGIEIAPHVSLYFEPWPSHVLPMPRSAGVKEDGTQQAKEPNSTGTGNSGGGGDTGEVKDKDEYFALVMCVGRYIYTSVTGVHERLIRFILGDWLTSVPSRIYKPEDRRAELASKLR